MKQSTRTIHITITGSLDFVRRMSNALRQAKLPFPFALSTGNFTEARALVLAERPDVLLFDVSHKSFK